MDDYDYSLANFSISKTTGLIFKQVLTINFDYLQFQSSKYSWNEHFDFDKTMLLNSMESLALLNAATKGKSKKIVNSELWEISLAITFSKAAMVLAKDLMCGKKINLTSQNDEQLTFCDSGLIVDGHHCSWSDVNIKVDDSTLFFKTDLDCYTIDHNSFASFLQYILHTTFQALQKKESLNNQISLSEKLFMFAQLTEWGLAQNVVQKHNGGVFSFPIKVK